MAGSGTGRQVYNNQTTKHLASQLVQGKEMYLLKLGGEKEEEGYKLEEKEVRWEKQESRVGCSGLARAS